MTIRLDESDMLDAVMKIKTLIYMRNGGESVSNMLFIHSVNRTAA